MIKKILTLFVFSSALLSCVDDVDFDQADDLQIEPVIEASLVFFEEPASSFLDEDGTEAETVQDTVRIEVFSDEFVVDNVIKAEFLFEGVNTINRAYSADIDFLDDENNVLHMVNLAIPESTDNTDVMVTHLETFEGITLESMKASTQLAFTLTLEPSDDGSILDENSPGNLRFRSKAAFYFAIDL